MLHIAIDVLAIHIFLAVVLFFVANWLGRYSVTSGYHLISLLEKVDEAPAFNFVFRVATPLVYLAITAALLYATGMDRYVRNSYLVVAYYFVIRWLYNIIVGRVRLLNWWVQLGVAVFTVFSAYVLYRKVLMLRSTLLPDAQSLNASLWLLVIIYVYTVLNSVPFTHAGAAHRRHDYIMHRYRTLHAAFASIISALAQNPAEEALVYAVLIYETFNRPYVYRAIERWVLFPLGLSKTLGPMQVKAISRQSDQITVTEGAKKLLDAFRRSFPIAEQSVSHWWKGEEAGKRQYVQAEAIREATRAYNIRSDYANEIESVYGVLVKELYPAAAQA